MALSVAFVTECSRDHLVAKMECVLLSAQLLQLITRILKMSVPADHCGVSFRTGTCEYN